MSVEVEEKLSKKMDKQGNPYKNLVIVEPRQYQPKDQGGDQFRSDVIRLLNDISAKIDRLPALITEKVVLELSELETAKPDGGEDGTDDNPFG